MTEDFRYDVAFSFLSAHEALALRVSDGLADRLATFVYSTSSTEQPERINGLPYNQVRVIWQPDGSGAIVEQRDAIGNFLYTPAGGDLYYDLQSTLGPNARAFLWRP
jgi:hypothetical protein